jgi:hypothetical protein
MVSGDAVQFDVVNGVPSSISGSTWTFTNNIYEISLNSNSVIKILKYYNLEGKNFIINYNSMDASNATDKKYHVKIYSFHP